MLNKSEKQITDWLYNRYVEAYRQDKYSHSSIYLEVLSKCAYSMTERKFSTLRRYAKSHLKEIYKALKVGRTKFLLLCGDEGQVEFEKVISDYEKQLREMGMEEEIIKDLVINKKLNYGN